jgi:hypothetical protein
MEEDTKYDKPGFGRLFKNKNKRADTHPDYVGSFVCDKDYKAGEKIAFGMWEKATRFDTMYYNLKADKPFQPSGGGYRRQEDREVSYRPRRRDDEDVPF